MGRGIIKKKHIGTARKILSRENKKYPSHFIEISEDEWSESQRKSGKILKVFRSKRYLVQVFKEEHAMCRLCVNRTAIKDNGDWVDGISWDDLQNIKSEIGYGDYDAVEVFPTDNLKVDVANMRHLFVFSEPLPYVWRKND